MPPSSRFSLPAVPAVLLSIVSVQGGAAIVKALFPLLGAADTTRVRIGLSAAAPRLGGPYQWNSCRQLLNPTAPPFLMLPLAEAHLAARLGDGQALA